MLQKLAVKRLPSPHLRRGNRGMVRFHSQLRPRSSPFHWPHEIPAQFTLLPRTCCLAKPTKPAHYCHHMEGA